MNSHNPLPLMYRINDEVVRSLGDGLPVVALESTVITHGLPYPENLTLALEMEAEVRAGGATPATIAVVEGQIVVGASEAQLQQLATGVDLHKISSREFGPAVAKKWSGGTTVAATLVAAEAAGIRVFATGGIGGVHRNAPFDVSADLEQLGRSRVVVVCAGAKAILDLPATIEYLETKGVPVVGYQTDDFPAFYSRSSGLKASVRADSPAEVAEIACAHWDLGLPGAILVGNPPPPEVALEPQAIEGIIRLALAEAETQRVRGQAVTPFLLKRVSELSGGASLKANLGLLKNNARLAARIAASLH